jgi:hypothetical protein
MSTPQQTLGAARPGQDPINEKFEALQQSASQLNNLKLELGKAESQHANAVKRFLESIESDESGRWEFRIAHKDGTTTKGLLTKEAHAMLRALSQPSREQLAGDASGYCPGHGGCANLSFAGHCVYICYSTSAKE